MTAIIDWMKQFLILYLVLTILIQLAAAEEYKKYVRFLSGIILLLALITPVLRLVGGGGDSKMTHAYDRFWKQIDDFTKEAQKLRTQQNGYERQTYENAVSTNLSEQVQEQGILVSQVRVALSDDYRLQRVDVWLDVVYRQQHPSAPDEVTVFLKETYGLDETQIFIY